MNANVSDTTEITNQYLKERLQLANSEVSEGNQCSTADPRSELDSHANMVVLGKHAFVFEKTGRTCNVQPFSKELGIATDVPIVDGAVAYDCPYSHQTSILIVRNALHIPTMDTNLIPPFIMRERGIIVNDKAKIHCGDPSIDDHCIVFNDAQFRIPLQLNGIFSYFHSRLPTVDELYECDKYFITPDANDWNPHCTSFEENERAMLAFDGQMSSDNRRLNTPMETEIEDPDALEISSVTVKQLDDFIDENISSAYVSPPMLDPNYIDDGSDRNDFAEALSVRGEISKLCASIGSCTLTDQSSGSLFDEPSTMTIDNLESMLQNMLDPCEMAKVQSVISAINAGTSKGPDPKHLSRLWLIDESLAAETINQTTQLCRQNADNSLSRQFSTNDRMLRYRRLQSTFFSDTMFTTPKAKSTRGFTCSQIFVSDRGYVATYPMKSQEEFPTALHWFCKQVGVPVKLVIDAHSAQKQNKVKRLCDQVGTLLRILEKGTPWANRAELYIGLLKEAVRKDLRHSNCPMVLWDYTIERRTVIHNVVPRPLFQNNGLTPHSATFGVPADISNICNFGWYEWVYYRDHGSFPIAKEKLGRVLGPIKNEGNEMAQAVLSSKGTILPRRTLRKLRREELHDETEKRKRQLFDDLIRAKLGDSITTPPQAYS